MYTLKADSPEFECVDGPLAGRKFRRGETYAEIPQQDASRFMRIEQSAERPPLLQGEGRGEDGLNAMPFAPSAMPHPGGDNK